MKIIERSVRQLSIYYTTNDKQAEIAFLDYNETSYPHDYFDKAALKELIKALEEVVEVMDGI